MSAEQGNVEEWELSPAERIVVEAMREGVEYIHREDFDREIARAEKAERALGEIANYIEAEFREGEKAYQAAILALAALFPEDSA